MSGGLRIHVRLVSCVNMGDHDEMVTTVHEALTGETVEHLVCRLMELGEFQRRFVSSKSPHARIEIQYVAGTEPEPTYDQTVPPF